MRKAGTHALQPEALVVQNVLMPEDFWTDASPLPGDGWHARMQSSCTGNPMYQSLLVGSTRL